MTTALKKTTEDHLLYHISSHEGTLSAVHRLFDVIQQKYSASHRIGYFNNNTSGVLAQAIRENTAEWIKDPQRMMKFEYERVNSIFELVDHVSVAKYNVVVVEHVDDIMQEHTTRSSTDQNRALTQLMAVPADLIMLDTWQYLDTYYLRQHL